MGASMCSALGKLKARENIRFEVHIDVIHIPNARRKRKVIKDLTPACPLRECNSVK